MANRRLRVTAGKMREVKGNLMLAMTDHARAVGRIPNVPAVESFLDPILARVEVEHEEDRTRDMMRPERARTGPAMARALGDPDVRLVAKPGVAYVAGADGVARAVAGPDDPRGALYAPGVTVGDDDIPASIVQSRLRLLHGIPAWRTRIEATWISPHEGPCTMARPCETIRMCKDHGMRKVERVLAIVRQSFAVFGDPRKPVATVLFVG